MNKITTFAATFGAMLVGILGATYGYEGLITFEEMTEILIQTNNR